MISNEERIMDVIVSIDPGQKHTGVAVNKGYVHGGDLKECYSIGIQIDEKQEVDMMDKVVDILNEHMANLTLVICEDFLLTSNPNVRASQTHRRFEEVQLIGVIKWWCFKNGVELVMQPNHLVKNVPIPKTYDRRGVTGAHTKDAVQHFRQYTMNVKHAMKPKDSRKIEF